MPAAPVTERRLTFRRLLERPQIISYGSVWDAVSARLAVSAGFEIGMLGGSIASHAAIGAPDLVVMTLTEFADQARRITRASSLPLLVDADHGYGNALNVMRTVEELENASVAGLTIEDTVLPRSYGSGDGEIISRDEYGDKLRAAVAARADAALVIIGRTGPVARAGLEETVARVRVATEAGVDAVFVLGAANLEQVRAVSDATELPLMLNAMAGTTEELVDLRARIVLQGHLPYFVAMKAIHDTYLLQRAKGPTAVPAESVASTELQAIALATDEYGNFADEYLDGRPK
jgi:carboxyvinyl-carboxyphosphonate phosphorylmutase